MESTPTHNDRNGTGKTLWRVVFYIALVVLICSLVALGVIAYSYFQGQAKYGNIASESGFKPDEVAEKPLDDIHVDWDALLAANPDTVGWIYVPGTVINYPVVRGTDNDYYLVHDFDGDQGWLANYGAIFMDYRNNPDMTDQQYFIYGHHMNDGSMFADLAGLADQARFDECRAVYFLTPRGNLKCKTYALLHASADDAIVQPTFATKEDMAAYVQDKIDRSAVSASGIPGASEIRTSIALATCDGLAEDGRYILYAYVEDATASGLSGDVGLEFVDGQANGFTSELTVQE